MSAKDTKTKTTTKKAAPKKAAVKNAAPKKTAPKEATPKKEVVEKLVIRKKFDGVVVSNKMEKTIVVRVDRVKVHSKYKKRYTVSKKYKVHDEKNQFNEGDKVNFVECRPMSKDKRHRVTYAK